MTSDLDIYRSANLIMKQHGDMADDYAAGRADELMAAGDVEGSRTWKRILAAVKAIRAPPDPGRYVS